MAEKKQSTKQVDERIVEVEREYFVLEYGVTVKATSAAEAAERAKKLIKES